MNILKTVFLIIIAVVVLTISKSLGWGLIVEAPLLLISFGIIVKYRKSIAFWFRRLPLPKFVVAIISTLPFMLFEENINCLPSGCQIIPPTIPFLMIFVFVLLLLVKFLKLKHISRPIVIFSILGLIIELTYGASAVPFRALPIPWFIFFSFWTALSYSYLVIVPMTILVED